MDELSAERSFPKLVFDKAVEAVDGMSRGRYGQRVRGRGFKVARGAGGGGGGGETAVVTRSTMKQPLPWSHVTQPIHQFSRLLDVLIPLLEATEEEGVAAAAAVAPPSSNTRTDTREKVVILGSGWAAHSFVKSLDATKYSACIVSPRNFFLFTVSADGYRRSKGEE